MQIEIEAEDFCRPTCPDLIVERYVMGDAGGLAARFYCKNGRRCRRIAEDIRQRCIEVREDETLVRL